MDSGFSRHMMGKIKDFLSLKNHEGGSVFFSDGNKGYIIDIGKIENSLGEAINGTLH